MYVGPLLLSILCLLAVGGVGVGVAFTLQRRPPQEQEPTFEVRARRPKPATSALLPRLLAAMILVPLLVGLAVVYSYLIHTTVELVLLELSEFTLSLPTWAPAHVARAFKGSWGASVKLSWSEGLVALFGAWKVASWLFFWLSFTWRSDARTSSNGGCSENAASPPPPIPTVAQAAPWTSAYTTLCQSHAATVAQLQQVESSLGVLSQGVADFVADKVSREDLLPFCRQVVHEQVETAVAEAFSGRLSESTCIRAILRRLKALEAGVPDVKAVQIAAAQTTANPISPARRRSTASVSSASSSLSLQSEVTSSASWSTESVACSEQPSLPPAQGATDRKQAKREAKSRPLAPKSATPIAAPVLVAKKLKKTKKSRAKPGEEKVVPPNLIEAMPAAATTRGDLVQILHSMDKMEKEAKVQAQKLTDMEKELANKGQAPLEAYWAQQNREKRYGPAPAGPLGADLVAMTRPQLQRHFGQQRRMHHIQRKMLEGYEIVRCDECGRQKAVGDPDHWCIRKPLQGQQITRRGVTYQPELVVHNHPGRRGAVITQQMAVDPAQLQANLRSQQQMVKDLGIGEPMVLDGPQVASMQYGMGGQPMMPGYPPHDPTATSSTPLSHFC